MNWEAIGAIAELLAAMGVIATLAYLAVQIRQNTAAQTASTELQKSHSWATIHRSIAGSEALADIWEKGFDDEQSLTPHEKRRFIWMIAEYFLIAEGMHNQHNLGYVSGESWYQHQGVVIGMLHNPLIRRWWDGYTTPITPSFREFIDIQFKKESPAAWNWQKLSDL